MTAILIILAVCVFVAGFYTGHGFALKDTPNDVHWLAYRVSRLAQRGVDSMTWIKSCSVNLALTS